MAQRIQVDSGLTPQRIRPQATPVDTFVQPTDGRGLSQLAQALSSLTPALSQYVDVEHDKEVKDNTARGEEAARKLAEQRISFADASKKGLIDPHENPWFIRSVKMQMGRAAAGKYGADLMETIATDPELQSSGDLAAFDAKEAEFRKQWLEKNVGQSDSHFEQGFGAISDGYVLDARRSFAAGAGARMEKTAGENHGVIIGQILEEATKTGDMRLAVDQINLETETYLRDNPKAGRIANLRAVQAVEDWARLHYKDVNQDSLTLLLKGINGGPGASLYGTHEAKEMIARATSTAIQLRQQDNQTADYTEKKDRKEKEEGLYTEMFKVFKDAKNPSAVSMDSFLARATAIDPSPDAIANVWQLRQSFVNAKAEGDPQAFEGALLRVYGVNQDQPGLLSLRDVARLAPRLSAQQVSSLMNEIEQRDQRAANGVDPVKKLFDKDIISNARAGLMKHMGVTDFSTDADMLARSGMAYNSFNRTIVERWEELSKLSPKALQAEMDSLTEHLFKAHANDDTLASSRETEKQVGQVAVAAAKGQYKDAISKLTQADDTVVDALRNSLAKMQAPKQRGQFTFSDPELQLLIRLGVKPTTKDIQQFFMELDRSPE